MLFVLVFLGIIFWIGYVVGKNSRTSRPTTAIKGNVQQLQVIYDIVDRIHSTQKKLDKETLVSLYAIQYVTTTPMTLEYALQIAENYVASLRSAPQKTLTELEKESTQPTQHVQQERVSQTQTGSYAYFKEAKPVHSPIDRTSQLLYFGAFLLITSIGLFVGFAEVEGSLKVLLVSLVSAILYSAGDYFYSKTKSLQPVGTTFISVALIAIPFIGVASHIYLFEQQHPELIWLATSVVSFAVYLFSLERYKQSLTGYLLIGSSVSSLLSIVGVLALPTHVFFWVLIATGLLFKLFSFKHASNELVAKPAEQFAQVLVPLALFASLLAIFNADINDGKFVLQESGQFSVSLFLTTLYAYTGQKTDQDKATAEVYGETVHPLFIAATTVGIYSYEQSLLQTGIAFQLIAVLYIVINFFISHSFRKSYEPTNLIVATLGIIATASSAIYACSGITIAILLCISLAYKFKDPLYAGLGSLLLIILGFVSGQYLLEPRFSLREQIWWSSGSIVILLLVSLLCYYNKAVRKYIFSRQIEVVALSGTALVLLMSITTLSEGFIALFGAICFASLLVYWLVVRKFSGESTSSMHDTWLVAAYSVLYISQASILMIQTERTLSYDVPASLSALFASILGALLTRASWTRWASSAQWLLLPVVFAYSGTLGASFSLPSIVLMYSVSAFFLMGSRLIALGRVQESFSKKPIVSLMGGESIAYMLGFLSCVGIVAMYSLFAEYNSMWQAIILTATTMALVWYLSFVERYKTATSVIPIASQLIIARLLWPSVSIFDDYSWQDARTLVPAASTVVALIVYSYFYSLGTAKEEYTNPQIKLSLAMMFTSPFYVFIFAQQTWSMALGLIIAGLVSLHYSMKESIGYKELSGAISTIGLMWLLANQGVTNLIFHFHIVAILLALYAVIREFKGFSIRSQSYSLSATLVLTIPLVLAALSEEGIYSLLLLIEMSALFVLGIFVSRKHIYRTGLYTAVGALAYQLRSYGYAVVALIAIVVIGFAIHSALKQDKRNDT